MNERETRAELLRAIAELGELFPEMRLGQMMANLATFAGRMDAGAIWDVEDAEALAAARDLIEQRSGNAVAGKG
jgi:hypothetical protein